MLHPDPSASVLLSPVFAYDMVTNVIIVVDPRKVMVAHFCSASSMDHEVTKVRYPGTIVALE